MEEVSEKIPVIRLRIERVRDIEAVPSINSPLAAWCILRDWSDSDREYLLAVHLDTRNKVIAVEEIYTGTLNTTHIELREVFKAAIVNNSAAILIGHNHPSGNPNISPEDIAVTRQIIDAGNLLGIDVLDHLVVSGTKFVSIRERGEGLNWPT